MDFEYIFYIVESINCIIRCSIITKNEVDMPSFDTTLASFDKSNSSFVVILDIDLNTVARKCQIQLL